MHIPWVFSSQVATEPTPSCWCVTVQREARNAKLGMLLKKSILKLQTSLLYRFTHTQTCPHRYAHTDMHTCMVSGLETSKEWQTQSNQAGCNSGKVSGLRCG